MKKSLSLVIPAFLISSVSFFTIACQNPLIGSSNRGTILLNPVVRDAKYYQEKIKQNQEYIVDCNKMLEEIKESENIYDDDFIVQSSIDEVSTQKYAYQSEINEYQYQILLLAKSVRYSSTKQFLLVVAEKIDNLNQELKLKEKYPEYYRESELEIIKDAIEAAKKLVMFIKLEEEQNVTI
ncbi:MAG: hypothetical protein ACRC8P_01970 [Spiroplasma sp.]